jgi:hypothetical protein
LNLNIKVNVEPWPTTDLAMMSPPIDKDILLQIFKPKPQPFSLRELESLSFPKLLNNF